MIEEWETKDGMCLDLGTTEINLDDAPSLSRLVDTIQFKI
jgi:hypothetical protein